MKLGTVPMRRTPIPVLTLCIVIGLSVPLTATGVPRQDLQIGQTIRAAVAETSGVRQTPASNGPIIVNWHFQRKNGYANLIVNPDGTYLFSGNYNRAVPTNALDIVIALKSSLGGVILFHYVGNVSNGGVQWSKEGQNAILKDNFKTFAGNHDWSGSYRFILDAEARKELRADQKYQCAGLAWAGGLTLTGEGQFCNQFNAAW
jgi:hypothetical protein